MNVRLSKRAQKAVSRIDARWREKGDHPETFLSELLAAIDLLGTTTNPGTPCSTAKRPRLKRVFLEKSKCHVYFEPDEASQALVVLAVWNARRERPPKL